MKQKKSSQDEETQNIIQNQSTSKDIDRLRALKLLEKEKTLNNSPAIGIHNDTYYFGVKLENNGIKFNSIVTSDKKVYVQWDLQNDTIRSEFGLNLKQDFLDTSVNKVWSNKSVRNYLEGNIKSRDIRDIFNDIVSINKKYISHVDDSTHDYVACDIISNYLYPIFSAKGRTYFHAEYESGKTKQTTIYSLLSFNSVMAANITAGAFDRVVEGTGGTILVDNFDNMSDELKKAITQVLETFYKQGGKSIKCDGRNNNPRAFEGYCPVVINNIIGLSDVTESRCNTISMIKTEDSNISKNKLPINSEIWNTLRDELHIFALENWKQIADIYSSLEVESLTGRDLEKAEAVLTIAKSVGEDIFIRLVDFFQKMSEDQKNKGFENNWEFHAFKLIYQDLQETNSDKIVVKIKTLSDRVARILDNNDDKRSISISLGKNTFGKYKVLFKHIHVDGGWSAYEVSRENLDKILRIKGFDKIIKVPKSQEGNDLEDVDFSDLS